MATAPLRRRKRKKPRQFTPGLPPGTVQVDPDAPIPTMHFIGYSATDLQEGEVVDPAELKALHGRWPVLWLNINGLGDASVLHAVGEAFGLHTLALEDVVSTHQRAKVEPYPEFLFIVIRLLRWIEAGIDLDNEQLSLFVGKGWVVTFQERVGDPFDPVRERIRTGRPNLRSRGADYLAYALLDAAVDSYFPLLETYSEVLEALDERVNARPDQETLKAVRAARRAGIALRRAVWPTRDAISALNSENMPFLTAPTQVYLRDLYDHILRVLDMVETYREEVSSLHDAYVSAVSFRMNEVMAVLTIVGSIFLPLSFLVGLYGMNFDTASPWNMPELSNPYGYPMLLGVMLLIAGSMLGLFWRRGWLFAPQSADD